MSVSDSWGRSEGGRWSANRDASEHPLAELAERLSEARRSGEPAPEELERLVALLAKSDIDPGDRLTRALEGFARWSDGSRAGSRAEQPVDLGGRARPAFTAPADDARPAPPPARSPEPRPQPKAAQTPPIASLRAALAEISARQKALDAEQEAPARSPQRESIRQPEARQPDARQAKVGQIDLRQPEPRRAQPEPRTADRDYVPADRPAASYGSTPTKASAPEAAAATLALKELRAELDRLGRSVKDLPTRSEIDRMTQEMSELARRLTDDRPARLDRDSLSAIDQLVAEVDRMRSEAPSPQIITKLSEEVHAISARLEVLGPRSSSAIESLARRIDDVRAELDQFPRVSAVDGVAREIQTLISRLDAQEAAAAPTREAVVGLSGRVQALDGQITAIAQATAARDEALDRINATIRTELGSMPRAAAVTDLGRQIDALTEGLKSRSAIGPALKAVEGLADKVEALDDKIAAIASFREEEAGRLTDIMRGEFAAAARPDAFEGLGRRIEALDDRLATIASHREQETGWLTDAVRDEIAASARPDMIESLSRQIEALTERVSTARTQPEPIEVTALTSRLDDLGGRFDTMAQATSARGAAFEQVEESIRAIAERLIETRSPTAAGPSALEGEVVRLVEALDQSDGRIEDLHHAFAGLAGRIERSCADLGAHAVESAVAAARDVLGAENGGNVGGRLEADLAAALSELRSTSAQSERRAADTLDAVRSTLERLLDRMENGQEPLEPELPEPPVRQFGRQPAAQVENATEVARAAAMRAMEEIADKPQPAAMRAPQVEEPAFKSTFGEFGPDHPLEPGAGLPRAESPTVQPSPQSAASLIASARRAQMQGAGEPVAGLNMSVGEPKSASRLSGALMSLKQNKRPIAIGVAALVIVFALYVASGMTDDGEQPAPPPPPAPLSQLEPAEQPRIGSNDATPAASDRSTDLAATNDQEFASAEETTAESDPSKKAAAATAPSGPAKSVEAMVSSNASAGASAPQAATRDVANFAFAEAGAAAKTRADWKTAEPTTTGSINRDPNALPDDIGGGLLKSRAQAGDAAAELEVGDRLLDGRNVPADPAAAARWFEKAAAQGSAPAQHRLGSLYEKGRGVPRDVAAARRWYEQAAASGNVRAMHNLGVVHAEGGLGKPDYAAAMVWFRMAAERGLTDSGYNLAVLAARGLGGKRDMLEAYKWFALAADQGDDDAARKRDEVAKALGTSITVAKASVTSFKPKAVDPAANDPQTPPGGWDRVAARANGADAGPVAR